MAAMETFYSASMTVRHFGRLQKLWGNEFGSLEVHTPIERQGVAKRMFGFGKGAGSLVKFPNCVISSWVKCPKPFKD